MDRVYFGRSITVKEVTELNVNEQQSNSNQTGPLPEPNKRWILSLLAVVLPGIATGIGGAVGVWSSLDARIQAVDNQDHQSRTEIARLEERCISTSEKIRRIEQKLDSIDMYLRGIKGNSFFYSEHTERIAKK